MSYTNIVPRPQSILGEKFREVNDMKSQKASRVAGTPHNYSIPTPPPFPTEEAVFLPSHTASTGKYFPLFTEDSRSLHDGHALHSTCRVGCASWVEAICLARMTARVRVCIRPLDDRYQTVDIVRQFVSEHVSVLPCLTLEYLGRQELTGPSRRNLYSTHSINDMQ